MLYFNRFISIVCLFLLVSCGSSISRKAATNTTDVADGDATGDSTTSSLCEITELTELEKNMGMSSININTLMVKNKFGGEEKSLCRVLVEAESDAAIMQLSGATCSSCVEEAKYFTNNLIKNIGEKSISHFVLFTDRESDYEEYFYSGFMNDFAPNSKRLHDTDIELWKFFSKDPANPIRPTIVSYNTNGKSIIINDKDGEYHSLVQQSVLLAAASGQRPVLENNDEEPEPDTDVDNDSGDNDSGDNDIVIPDLENLAGLSLEQNVGIINAEGIVTDFVTMFGSETEYLVIDISQINCPYCTDLAEAHNLNLDFQNLFNSEKCKNITLVADSQLSGWLSYFPQDSFTSKNSYGVISNIWDVGTKFGLEIRSTPTVFMIDRNGDVVASQAGGTPSEVNMCR